MQKALLGTQTLLRLSLLLATYAVTYGLGVQRDLGEEFRVRNEWFATSHRLPGVDSFVFIDNGFVRVGVDASRGGTIGYLSLSSSSENLLNHHDYGRLVQGSFYSGPNPYDVDHKCEGSSWDPWPWNPIGGGDAFNHSAKLLELTNTSTTAHVVSQPYQWACDDEPCDCTFTQDIVLRGSAVEVTLTLSNDRKDGLGSAYSFDQELPAIYIIGQFCHLFTVNSSSPWTGETPVEVPATWPWSTYRPSERWLAFSNGTGPTDLAVGVWSPNLAHALAGRFFSSPPVSCGGEASDDPTGYIAPVQQEVLDPTIKFAYNFSLVVGTTLEIQAYALAQHVAGRNVPDIPQYVFSMDTGRAHCTLQGGQVDSGWPVPADGLRLALNASNGLVAGPWTSWDAADMPALLVNGSWPVDGQIGVFFETWGSSEPCAACGVYASVSAGPFSVVRVDLSSAAAYTGRMQRIALRPAVMAQPGEWAQVASIFGGS
jgi:hypothetical protein